MNKLYLDTCAGSLGIAIVTKDKKSPPDFVN